MTSDEFKTYFRRFGELFPDRAAWITNKGDAGKPFNRAWCDLFANIRLDDALASLDRCFAGDEGYPDLGNAYGDNERLPRTTLALARTAERSRRNGNAGLEPLQRRDRAKYQPARTGGVGAAFARIVELRSAGTTDLATIMETLETEGHFPPSDPADEPTYRCLTCFDQGIVTVWHHLTVKAVEDQGREGLQNHRYRRSMSAPCSCDRGLGYVGERRLWRRERTIYTDDRYCLIRNSTENATDQQNLIDWIDRQNGPTPFAMSLDQYNAITNEETQ